MERKVIVITGPTCSGKTYVSVRAAELLNTEIISADSRQVYKFLDIGTAKPALKDLEKIKHHFISSLLPDEEFNVSQFEQNSVFIFQSLFNRRKIPVVTGGSGLYIKALVDGIFNTVDTDEEYRRQLNEQMQNYGKEYLYNELKKKDPISAMKMLPQNWKRVMRALEVYRITGKPIWEHQSEYSRKINFSFVRFGLNWPREKLYENIEKRVDKMIENGLVNEVKSIISMGFSKELNSLNTVGYKEIISYLENDITLEGAVELIKRNTRRFAKRQLTWFRKDARINWLNINSEKELDLIIPKILENTTAD